MADYIDELQIGTNGTPVPLRDAGARELIAKCAPAGYGLGVMATTLATVLDANDAINTGWYKTGTSTANAMQASGILRVEARETGYIKQTEIQATTGIERTRTCIGGAWGEWEWVNPPMDIGVEYRTTERWNGKTVYTRIVDCGYLPASSKKKVSWDTTGQCCPIRCSGEAMVSPTQDPKSIPYYNEGNSIQVGVTNWDIYITTTGDYSSQQARVQVWYTKG